MHSLHRVLVMLVTALLLLPQELRAHDPDVRGGVFRTHDAGATWTPINPGIFGSGTLALAVSPRDSNHLLLATDSGVWRSRNGGRDWDVEAPNVLAGPAFAVAFDADGQCALVAGASTVFRNDGDRWRPVRTPAGAAPARALIAGAAPGRVYLAGRSGLYRSDDNGGSWANAGPARESVPVDRLIAPSGHPDDVHALIAGSIWSSSDGARTWQRRAGGAPTTGFEAVGLESTIPTRLWAVGAGQMFMSDRSGERWNPVGKPLPETRAVAFVLAVSGAVVLMGTDRGVFRSTDAGERWELINEGLPAHLAARVLVTEPRSPDTIYAGFALTSYEMLQTLAPPGGSASARFDLGLRVGAFGLVVLLALGMLAAARQLLRKFHVGQPDADATRSAPGPIGQPRP